MSAPFFSIGMIFKNEIRCLERCLESLRPLREAVPCELIMADTGSTDGSREVAERYADVLFDFPWINDFAAARNAVMERCSGQWYFTIDADEWIKSDVSELVAFSKAKSLPEDLGAINIRNYNTVELDENKQFNDFSGIRLLRLSTGVRYTGCIHEKWVLPNGRPTKAMMLYNTWLGHDGYAYADEAALKAKHDRNIVLLRRKVSEDPEDIQALVECIDMMKRDPEGVEYARRLASLIPQDPPHWDKFGPLVFRAMVSVAKLQSLPELMEWASQAVQTFPESIFIRSDVAYYALADCIDRRDTSGSIYWGEMYQQALLDYHAGKYDHSELLRGGVEYVSSFWQRKAFILLSQAYLDDGKAEKAYVTMQKVDGSEIEELRQVESITKMLMRLHRTAVLDTPLLLATFWEQIGRSEPTEALGKARRAAFLSTASTSFPREYRIEEKKRDGFVRHAYTIFSVLKDKCTLGRAACILDTDDISQLTSMFSQFDDWDGLPIAALSHAIKRGMAFPLPGSLLHIEEMDKLIRRLAQDKEDFISLVMDVLGGDFSQTLQSLCWARGLVLTALRITDWTARKIPKGGVLTLRMDDPGEPVMDVEEINMTIARTFARVEGVYLQTCYVPGLLSKDTLFILPPLHRFGWYCAQAFQALDRGNQVAYVRLLREGLTSCESAKDIAEFLLEHIPDVKPQQPSTEMAALAEQIRVMLAKFASDDPAVAVLKQSEAYRKVAHLIEGLEPPVAGGLVQ